MSSFKIEKMVYGGDGLARQADESGRSKAVFVPFVLPGEEVDAHITEKGRGFSRAALNRVVVPSGRRVEPRCPYFLRCGGCHYQHTDYAHQLEIKTQILRETLLRTAKFDWQDEIPTHAGEPWNYRNRTRMKLRGGGSTFAIGYYRLASHELLAVEECPISSPLINKALAAIWEFGRGGAVPAEVSEIEFFANADDDQVLLELYGQVAAEERRLQAFAEALQEKIPALAGLAAFDGRAGEASKVYWSFGATELAYNTAADTYHVRAGSFFQSNRHLTDGLIGLVTDGQSGRKVLDLYAGTGLFALPLARAFTKVVAVEAAPASYADLRTNAPENMECQRSTTQDFLERPMKSAAELIVVDPPRAGLGDKVTASLVKSRAERIIYVSCDPATLARDLHILMIGGYTVQAIDLIDLFPQTFHIETVVHLGR